MHACTSYLLIISISILCVCILKHLSTPDFSSIPQGPLQASLFLLVTYFSERLASQYLQS